MTGHREVIRRFARARVCVPKILELACRVSRVFFCSFVPMTASGLTGLRADVAANGVIPADTNGKTIVFSHFARFNTKKMNELSKLIN